MDLHASSLAEIHTGHEEWLKEKFNIEHLHVLRTRKQKPSFYNTDDKI
jgi:hypothetical protein